VIAPTGDALFSAPLHDEGVYVVDVDLEDVRRERIALPLLRDEQPETVLRQLERIVRERAGFATAPPADGRVEIRTDGTVEGRSGDLRASASDEPTRARVVEPRS
jgi:hypothetical protein